MNSFFPDAITSWNNVIIHFDNIPSINIFKDQILSLIRPKGKNIFGSYTLGSFRTSIPHSIESGLKFIKMSQQMSQLH